MSSSAARLSESSDIEALKPGTAKEQLLLGHVPVNPAKVVNGFVVAYIFMFVLHRVADITNLITLDCRFPKGLQYLYAEDSERETCMAYQRTVNGVVLVWSTVNFVVVMALLYTRFFLKLDDWVGRAIALVGSALENNPCSCIWDVIRRVATACYSCISSPLRCCGLEPKVDQLFHGALYITIISAIFYVIDAPFKVWIYDIDVEFGFANTVSLPASAYKWAQISGFISILSGVGIPSMMLYLWVLNWKYGWLLMWAGLVAGMTISQYYLYQLAPMVLGPTNVFPSEEFGVGRNFPLVQETAPNATNPEVSLNRIYYPTNESGVYVTHDFSKGSVVLDTEAKKMGQAAQWELVASDAGNNTVPYAETVAKIKIHNSSTALEPLANTTWSVHGVDGEQRARLGFRRGRELRDALFDFAEQRNVHINEVYLIDSSSKDSRANAFAAGAGNGRVIALYDTLFLGSNNVMTVQGGPEKNPEDLFSIRHWSRVVQGVPKSKRKPTWFKHRSEQLGFKSRDPGGGTTAMTDAEILAVMGHELGHSALHHVERGSVTQAATSFLTFALLGWAASSPVLAAGVGLAAPVVHVGVFLYNRLLHQVLDGFLTPVENALTRRQEYQADAYSARVSLDYAEALQTGLAKLTVSCNQDPNEPWYQELLHDDHPTLAHRWQQVATIKRHLYPNATLHTES